MLATLLLAAATPAESAVPAGSDLVTELPTLGPVTQPEFAGYASASATACTDLACSDRPGLFYWLVGRDAGYGTPDAHVEPIAIIEEGDMVPFRLDGSGTHLGPLLGVEPTGKTVRIRGIHHVRLRDGRIVEHWQGPDILAMRLFPPTAGSR